MSETVKKILICGGCGFMGSQFIRYLHNKYPNYEIHNLDLLTYAGNPENLSDLAKSSRYHFVQGDIGDKSLVEDLMVKNKFDVVINFAAESHVDRSIVNAFQFIKTNIQGAYVLLEAARHYKIPRFVYISTDEIYGDIPHGVKTDENYPLQPTNPYAASKAAADLMVQAYIKTHRVPALILRSSNNYGPYQYPEKLHSLVITNLLEGKKVPLHGKGHHLRSWIHTQDFCNALDLVMHKGEEHRIYNVAGEERSNIEVIRAIADVLGKDHSEHLEYVNDRPGADFRYAPDHSRISKELKWERQNHYESALPEIVSWYEKNREWWHKVKQRTEFQDHYSKQSKGQYDL
ncbi:MAG: dTDP-glucose 4,6-dehydratase [bacterium]|nr:dTDP-glucose 4,6-dehydratase [bacterium]